MLIGRRADSNMMFQSFKGFLTRRIFGLVVAVGEVLDFKWVPEDHRVSLVATKSWGRVVAWWQQLK